MTTTTGHRLAERFAETLTAHDLDAFSAQLHPDYVNHNRYAEPSKAGSVAIFSAFLSAFDGFRVEVDDIIDAGGTVVGRYTYRGRHTGTFLGVPASGVEIEMHSIDIWRVRDGQFVEHWDEDDLLGLAQQMRATLRPRCGLAGISLRQNARLSAERIDFDPAVVGKHGRIRNPRCVQLLAQRARL